MLDSYYLFQCVIAQILLVLTSPYNNFSKSFSNIGYTLHFRLKTYFSSKFFSMWVIENHIKLKIIRLK